jgi:hypothetical protein
MQDPKLEIDGMPTFFDSVETTDSGREIHVRAANITVRTPEEWQSDPKHTNLVVAAFITSYARLKLYSVLNYLDRRVLYYDTDSVIFYSEAGDVDPKRGELLGDLTNEVGKAERIREFFALAPKTYGLLIEDTASGAVRASLKVKGFSFTDSSQHTLSYANLKALARGSRTELSHTYTQFRIDKHEREVSTGPLQKVLRNRYNKRVLWKTPDSHSIDTIPYGYNPLCDDTVPPEELTAPSHGIM